MEWPVPEKEAPLDPLGAPDLQGSRRPQQMTMTSVHWARMASRAAVGEIGRHRQLVSLRYRHHRGGHMQHRSESTGWPKGSGAEAGRGEQRRCPAAGLAAGGQSDCSAGPCRRVSLALASQPVRSDPVHPGAIGTARCRFVADRGRPRHWPKRHTMKAGTCCAS